MTTMNPSVITYSQTRTYGPKPIAGWGKGALIRAKVRHDDNCRNGHNSFAVTGEVYIPGKRDVEACGCMHDEIAQHFPELAHVIKWHLCSTDGPMHYVANSLYWAGQTKWEKPNLANFRSTAIWPDATEHDMLTVTPEILSARLPALMEEFQAAVESLGFTY